MKNMDSVDISRSTFLAELKELKVTLQSSLTKLGETKVTADLLDDVSSRRFPASSFQEASDSSQESGDPDL